MVQAPLNARARRSAAPMLLGGIGLLLLLCAPRGAAQTMGSHESASTQGRALARSVHRSLGCQSCHSERSFEMGGPVDPVRSCASCHVAQARTALRDAHAAARSERRATAPTCVSCHGSHGVRATADPWSPTHPANVSGRCSSCHARAVRSYTEGVHATVGSSPGAIPAATCTRCHAAHDARRSDDPASSVSRGRVAATCARCHAEAAAAYGTSVHATAVRVGDPHAATCVSCHTGHEIRGVSALGADAETRRRAAVTCASCHGDVRLSARHGFSVAAVADYRGSFHGLAAAVGDRRVANCASCHGNHDIRSASDSASRTHPANIGATCGSCHEGATASFARGGVHHTSTARGHDVVDGVRWMYGTMIAALITLMVLHNALDLSGAWRDRRHRRPIPDAVGLPAERHLRFTVNERLQHWLLVGSFLALVLSGFALKLGWAVPGLEPAAGAALRGWVHRIAALALIALGLYHLAYLAFTTRGRAMARALLPRLTRPADAVCLAGCCVRLGPPSVSDWRDLVQTLRYGLGLTSKRPRFGRFTYAEKMEYFALVWGTIVMGVTGSVLWLEVPFLNRFPYWSFELATVVHLYEATLASLAIVVWHFYFVMLRPDVFPLSMAMVTGEVSRQQMEHEHPLELEEMQSKPDRSDGEPRAPGAADGLH